jgi:hypothetical protein
VATFIRFCIQLILYTTTTIIIRRDCVDIRALRFATVTQHVKHFFLLKNTSFQATL